MLMVESRETMGEEAYRFDVLALGWFSRHGGLHDGVKEGCPQCRVEVLVIFGRIRRCMTAIRSTLGLPSELDIQHGQDCFIEFSL